MRSAASIVSRFAGGVRRIASRRPQPVVVGFFVGIALLGVACSDNMIPPTAPTTIKAPRLNLSATEGTRIGTDKQDYYLGEKVQIEGWEWTAGETVRLQVVHLDENGDNSRPEHQPWDITAGQDGFFTASWDIALESDELGATLKLTADGVTSGTHAEVTFTDLDGTVNLFVDAARTTAQTAYQWGATVYPRIRSPKKSTCYRLTWTDPSSDVTKTYFETGDPPGTNADPTGIAVGQESGRWSLVVDQRASGTCNNDVGYASATSAIFFDVARRVIIGAGTSGTTDGASPAGGDQCVYQTNNIGGVCQVAASPTMFVRAFTNDSIRSYVRFDLTTVAPAIPAGVIVTSAKVRLSVAGTAGTVGSPRTYSIRRADAGWTEGAVTWATQPGATGSSNTAQMAYSLVAGTGGGDPQTWVSWSVTADVQGFLDGGTNYGWRISDHGTSSTSAGRFHTTENTSGCAAGVAAADCKRTWPVLLIDYADPPKLVFSTTSFTRQVGACSPAIRVQSQDFGGSPLAVSSDLTVNLSTANLGVGSGGTAGAGSFFSNSTCTTAATTTTISTGNTESSNFYYRATGRGDGTHDLVASATGYTPDASQTETITKALTSLLYTGDRFVFVGNTFTFSSTLSSAWAPCINNKRIIFRILPSPLDNSVAFFDPPAPNPYTNSSGVATKSTSTTGWIEGIYDGRASFPGDDDCAASKDDYAISIVTPGGAATGGGFLAGGKVGGGRANFGFTIRPIDGSDPIAYKGQFLLIRQDGGLPSFRCKGAIELYGTVSGSDPLLNVATGHCDFQVWNASLNGGEGGWEVPYGAGYVNRQFTIQFIDNGSGKGKYAPPPDQFGFSINFVGSIADPSFNIADINGGNIDVKGTTTTTTGSTTGGGKKR